MRLSSKTSKKFLPLALTSAIAAAIAGCNGGSGGDSAGSGNTTPSPVASANKVEVPVDSVFAAMLIGKVNHNAAEVAVEPEAQQKTPSVVTYYQAELVALNADTGEEQRFEWPMAVDDADDIAMSQKTVTIEPGVYHFTLSVTRDGEQYIGMLADYAIADGGEVRLPMELEPVVGQTIVNVEAIMTPAQISLEYPAEELVDIEEPVIGIIIDGVEHFFAINKTTGIADVLLSVEEGPHTYDINLYNGEMLIGRSEVGEQTFDLALDSSLDIDLVRLQADITVEDTGLDEPVFTFKIPPALIDLVGDVNLVKLDVRLLDSLGDAQSGRLDIVQENGEYLARHAFSTTMTMPVVAYLEFIDMTSGVGEIYASCDNTVAIGALDNTVSCLGEAPVPYNFKGNLLATLSINVLDIEGAAQSDAEVFIDGVSAGITGSNFGTDGFLKKFEIAGPVRVSAEKGELSASQDIVSTALGINNITLVLKGPDPVPPGGDTCKSIKGAYPHAESGLYELNPDGLGGVEPFTTYCDMDTDGGGWTLVQNRKSQVALATTYNLDGAAVTGAETLSDDALAGAISNDAWAVLKSQATELLVYGSVNYSSSDRFYTTVSHLNGIDEAISCAPWSSANDLLVLHFLWYESDCNNAGTDISGIGYPSVQYASIVYNHLPNIWLEADVAQSGYPSGASIYVR